MKRKHKERWSEWSTEQLASNYLVANMPGTKVLPFPLYGTPDVLDDYSVFMHFMGYQRYTTGKYKTATDQVIARLIINNKPDREKSLNELPYDRPHSKS